MQLTNEADFSSPKATMRRFSSMIITLCFSLFACAVQEQTSPYSYAESNPTPSLTPPETSTTVIDWFPATATWTVSPNIEPSSTPILIPGIEKQIFSDDFSQAENWSRAKTSSDGGNNIIINRNRITLAANITPVGLSSVHKSLVLTDFYAETTVSINRCFGPDAYGLLFRTASETYTYRYLLNCNGQMRTERVQDGKTLPLQEWIPSGDVPPGAPGQVKIGVWVAGSEMRFFLNGRYQFSIIDPLFKSGSLGVFLNAVSPDGMNISFSDLIISSVNYIPPSPTATPSRVPTSTRTPRPTP